MLAGCLQGPSIHQECWVAVPVCLGLLLECEVDKTVEARLVHLVTQNSHMRVTRSFRSPRVRRMATAPSLDSIESLWSSWLFRLSSASFRESCFIQAWRTLYILHMSSSAVLIVLTFLIRHCHSNSRPVYRQKSCKALRRSSSSSSSRESQWSATCPPICNRPSKSRLLTAFPLFPDCPPGNTCESPSTRCGLRPLVSTSRHIRRASPSRQNLTVHCCIHNPCLASTPSFHDYCSTSFRRLLTTELCICNTGGGVKHLVFAGSWPWRVRGRTTLENRVGKAILEVARPCCVAASW
ncbi:hypothetical protein E2C01_028793 [Portunus trituberculatus]|uniref:Uncharacterized protein n=1 Tax=Portunus trituberculatus TaxID=210409 RepID=A0A5B7ELE2_PORTR|nr:hypothetical protein [Portunus trituberculatus]